MNKLRYMLGPVFVRLGNSWCAGLRFYWFSIFFYKRWDPDLFYGDGNPCPWTGFVLCYRPSHATLAGAQIWLKSKRWFWLDYPKEVRYP